MIGLIRDLDPRVRIVAALAFALVVVAGSDFTMLSVALLLAVTLSALARLPWRQTLKRVLAMDLFIVVMLLTLPFTLPGEPLWQAGPLTASREGTYQAAAIALKANAVIFALLALVGTLEAAALGQALARLRVPDKLIHLLHFTVRYSELLTREYHRLRQAMRARAFVPGSNRHTWRSLGYLFGMLLVRSLERAERTLAAMKCRGFDGRYHCLDDLVIGPRDRIFTAAFGTGLLGLIGLEVWNLSFI